MVQLRNGNLTPLGRPLITYSFLTPLATESAFDLPPGRAPSFPRPTASDPAYSTTSLYLRTETDQSVSASAPYSPFESISYLSLPASILNYLFSYVMTTSAPYEDTSAASSPETADSTVDSDSIYGRKGTSNNYSTGTRILLLETHCFRELNKVYSQSLEQVPLLLLLDFIPTSLSKSNAYGFPSFVSEVSLISCSESVSSKQESCP